MADYYRDTDNPKKFKDEEKKHTANRVATLTYASLVLGVISLFVLIALNLTNIAMIIRGNSLGQGGCADLDTLKSKIEQIDSELQTDLKPKTGLINNMVSYQIPNILNQIQTTIKKDVLKACAPQFNYNKTQCPLSSNPVHSGSFSLLQRNFIQRCSQPNVNLYIGERISLTNFPSFVPGPTKPGGCNRHPSFGLSSKIFTYSHNVVPQGCNSSLKTTQYWSIGRITDVEADMPFFENLKGWYLDDGLNRKTCTVAAGEFGAWMACTISSESDLDDFRSPGVSRVFLGYMDIYGRQHEWYLSESEIEFTEPLSAMMFSIGSGLVEDGKVYFLIYGGLLIDRDIDAFCEAPRCSDPDQNICNQAQKPPEYANRQMVNGILYFNDDISKPIRPKVHIFPPNTNWFGTKGRIYKAPLDSYAYVYIASESWYPYLKLGLITLDEDFDLVWVINTAYTRPGSVNCDGSNTCPQNCKAYSYTDMFPLDGVYEYSLGMLYNHRASKEYPAVMLVNRQRMVYGEEILATPRHSGMTTTTCFRYGKNLWCLSIVSLEPATVGSRQPVPFLYKVVLKCRVPLSRSTGPNYPVFESIKVSKYKNRTIIMVPALPTLDPYNETIPFNHGVVTMPPPLDSSEFSDESTETAGADTQEDPGRMMITTTFVQKKADYEGVLHPTPQIYERTDAENLRKSPSYTPSYPMNITREGNTTHPIPVLNNQTLIHINETSTSDDVIIGTVTPQINTLQPDTEDYLTSVTVSSDTTSSMVTNNNYITAGASDTRSITEVNDTISYTINSTPVFVKHITSLMNSAFKSLVSIIASEPDTTKGLYNDSINEEVTTDRLSIHQTPASHIITQGNQDSYPQENNHTPSPETTTSDDTKQIEITPTEPSTPVQNTTTGNLLKETSTPTEQAGTRLVNS